MQTFLIALPSDEEREHAALAILNEHMIDVFDRTVIEQKKSIGIEDVRTIQKNVFLKPRKSNAKAVVIKNVHMATLEAQSALLKLLEEPPANTIIILTAKKKELLLPTVLSRCFIIEKGGEKQQEEPSSPRPHPIFKIAESSIAARLRLAQEVGKTREDALAFLEDAIASTHELFTLPALLRSLQTTHTVIATTNVPSRLALEHLFLTS